MNFGSCSADKAIAESFYKILVLFIDTIEIVIPVLAYILKTCTVGSVHVVPFLIHASQQSQHSQHSQPSQQSQKSCGTLHQVSASAAVQHLTQR